MRIQYHTIKENKGNILLLCIVGMAILITFTNLITAVVTGRSLFTRKVADLNEFMLLIEDANIQYQNEFLVLQSENVELIQYYFVNRFYEQKFVGGFSGSSAFHNRYLKACIAPEFQRMIQAYYKEVIKPMETPGKPEYDIASAEDEIAQMADFLYFYLTTYRLSEKSPMVPTQYTMKKRLEDRTKSIKDKLKLEGKGNFTTTQSENNIRRDVLLYRGAVADIDANTFSEYNAKCRDGSGALLELGSYRMVTELEVARSYKLGINSIEQQAKYTLMPENFTAVHNGVAYDMTTSSLGDQKLNVDIWIIKGLR